MEAVLAAALGSQIARWRVVTRSGAEAAEKLFHRAGWAPNARLSWDSACAKEKSMPRVWDTVEMQSQAQS